LPGGGRLLGRHPSVEEVFDAASAETGLTDLGTLEEPASVLRRSLRNLSDALASDSISDDTRAAAWGQILEVLGWRMRMVEDRRKFPGIAAEVIRRPLFVIGYPRCGTTLLHCLLAEDPASRTPRVWEVHRPSPPPSLASSCDTRVADGHRDVERFLSGLPGFIAQHPYFDLGGLTPEECEAMFVYDLRNSYPIQIPLVPRSPWAVAGDSLSRYELHRNLLQHLQYRGAADKRWLLKGTQHHFNLAAIRSVYPDAMLVWTHRDPAQVFGSLIQVLGALNGAAGGSAEVRHAHAEAVLGEYLPPLMDILDDSLISEAWICHVRYTDLVAAPVAVVAGVYKHFGLPWTADVESRVSRWLADPANKPDRYGKFTYSLEPYGITEAGIRERFGRYCDRFGL
jgi:hypothetical protein